MRAKMRAKTERKPDLGQEIITASADAMHAMAVAGKDMLDSVFGHREAKTTPVIRRTHARKVTPKKARKARRK